MSGVAPSGNVLGGLQGFLANFGVVEVSRRDEVVAFAEKYLKDAGLGARVTQLRHHRLTVEANAQVAVFLRYRLDDMQAVLEVEYPGEVQSISVVVRP